MFYEVFFYNLLSLAIAAPAGAGVLALMTWPVQGWRAALRGWWYMAVLFFALGSIDALLTLFTGEPFGHRSDCPGALYGYSCH